MTRSQTAVWEMIKKVKSCQPEVKASKSDKRLQSLVNMDMYVFDTGNTSHKHLLINTQVPTRKIFEKPYKQLLRYEFFPIDFFPIHVFVTNGQTNGQTDMWAQAGSKI